jgi:hypothetical protein
MLNKNSDRFGYLQVTQEEYDRIMRESKEAHESFEKHKRNEKCWNIIMYSIAAVMFVLACLFSVFGK